MPQGNDQELPAEIPPAQAMGQQGRLSALINNTQQPNPMQNLMALLPLLARQGGLNQMRTRTVGPATANQGLLHLLMNR
jgi:hypothetical protein